MTARGVLPFPAVPVPEDRGRWLTVDDVRAMLDNTVSRDWVYGHVPGKRRLSHRVVRWREHEVAAWLEERRA